MYVWIDALVNYLTSLDFPNTSEEQFIYWKNCNHIIGKDILKFHACILASYVNGCGYSIT